MPEPSPGGAVSPPEPPERPERPEVRTIVAMGGGGFSMEPDNPLLDRFVLDLARGAARRAGRDVARPRICFLPTASGDAEGYIERFHEAFDAIAEAAHLALFERTVSDVAGFIGDQDAIYVGGGNTENMLAIWRIHDVDRALRAAWERGVVMAGLSAGSLCWFESGTTDSYGPELSMLGGGLGFLAGSHCPHYDGEPGRRPLFHRLIGEGRLPAGYAADDGAALVFRGTTLEACVSSRPAAACYHVAGLPDGQATERRLPTRYLGTA
jgi:peptidase E